MNTFTAPLVLDMYAVLCPGKNIILIEGNICFAQIRILYRSRVTFVSTCFWMVNESWVLQVQDAGGFDAEGCGVPDSERRVVARWEPSSESGLVRDLVDGGGVR